MSVDKNRPSDLRRQSELDRRAIRVAGHLLVAGIWLERQLGKAPKLLLGPAEGPEADRPALALSRPNHLTLVPIGGEELR